MSASQIEVPSIIIEAAGRRLVSTQDDKCGQPSVRHDRQGGLGVFGQEWTALEADEYVLSA